MTRFEIGPVVLNKTAACVGLSLSFVSFSVSLILPSSLFSVSLHVSSSLCQFEFSLSSPSSSWFLRSVAPPFHLFRMLQLFSHISPNYWEKLSVTNISCNRETKRRASGGAEEDVNPLTSSPSQGCKGGKKRSERWRSDHHHRDCHKQTDYESERDGGKNWERERERVCGSASMLSTLQDDKRLLPLQLVGTATNQSADREGAFRLYPTPKTRSGERGR